MCFLFVVVKCPPLPNPTAGKWSRPDCSQTEQLCNSHCTLECVGFKGYTRVGNNPTRTCQNSKTWSSTTTYCKGTIKLRPVKVHFVTQARPIHVELRIYIPGEWGMSFNRTNITHTFLRRRGKAKNHMSSRCYVG